MKSGTAWTLKPKTWTLKPKTWTLNLKTWTLNLKTWTLNLKTWTRFENHELIYSADRNEVYPLKAATGGYDQQVTPDYAKRATSGRRITQIKYFVSAYNNRMVVDFDFTYSLKLGPWNLNLIFANNFYLHRFQIVPKLRLVNTNKR